MSISLGLVLAFVLQAPGAAVSPWRVVGQCEPLAGDVERFVVSPDGARAATAGEDGRVVLWDVERRAEIARYDGAGDHGALLAFSDDSKLLAAHVPHWRPDTFRVWSSTDGKELTGWSTIPLGPGTERSDRDLGVWREGAELHLHEGGAALFHPSDFQSLHVSSTRILGRGPQCTERRFAIVAGGRQVVVARVSGCVGGRVPDGRREDELDLGWYAVDGGAELARFHWVEQQPESNPCPGDQLAVTADEVAFPVQGVVRVYGLDGKERARFASGVRALVDFGAQRVTGHADGSVAFWDGAKRVARVQALAGPVRGLKHDDGRVLVEGGGRYALIDRERRLFGPVAAQEGRVFERITLLRDSEGRFSCHEDARLLRILSTTSWIYDEYDRRNVPCEVRDARAWFVDGGRLLSAGLDEVGAPFAIGSHRAAIQDVQFGPVGVLVSSRRAARVLDASGVLVGEPVPSAAVAWLGGVASRVDGGVVHARAPWTRAASAPIHAVRIEGRVRVTLAGGAVEEVELGRPGAPLALSPDGGRIACAWRPDGRRASRCACSSSRANGPRGARRSRSRVPSSSTSIRAADDSPCATAIECTSSTSRASSRSRRRAGPRR
ncbi:MAG: hypothetical protein IPJ77_14680 [Planctomycetes bacterium]|nr:hypothetical protein [Planctomycetota bacterium]